MREVTKTVLKFFAGFLAVLTASAFLAPWIFKLFPFKFGRILRRLIMIGSVGLVLWLLRARRKTLGRLGLGWRKESLRLLAAGLLGGVFMGIAITLAQYGLGARFWHLKEAGLGHWIGYFFKGMGAGLLIGMIEEFFFRGFLFLTLEELWNRKASLVVTNLIYAVVHFFPKGGPPQGVEPTAADSFRILGSALSNGSRPEVLPALLGLFLFGLILSLVFLRAGSLYPAIGVHAGAVFMLKLNRRFLPEIFEKMNFLSGGKNLYDGIAGLSFLVLILFFLTRRAPRLSGSRFRAGGLPLVLTAFLFCHPLPAQAAEGGPPGEIVFSFLQELPRARSVRQGEDKSVVGEWIGGRFHFEGLGDLTDIYTTENVPVEGKTRMAVWFQPWKDLETTLVFSSVPAGKRLYLFFALGDADFMRGKPGPVYFEAWIGKKKLFDTQVSTKGWKAKSFDLMLPYLLERKFRLSLKVRGPDKLPTSFIFYGYIE